MSDWIKCDRCNNITKADSSGDKRYKIGVDGFDGYSAFHLCEGCLRSFYLDFLQWEWNDDESQYVPQESDREIKKLEEELDYAKFRCALPIAIARPSSPKAERAGYSDAIDNYRCEEREQGKCPFYAS